MIVKVVVTDDELSIFDTENWRIYHSVSQVDIDFAKGLNGPGTDPTGKFYSVQYYNAKWNKGVVAIVKRATGYKF